MNDNRRKLTGILKLLYENTDADHSMNTYQIMDALESMGHGRPDRKTIDANIKFIIEDLGFGIRKEKGKPNRYRWTDREFDLSELELLADAVLSSRFISQKKSREIIAKLKDLTSIHQAASLNRELCTADVFKCDGSKYLPLIDIINEAIKSQLCLTFMLSDFDIDKKEYLCNNGKLLEVSPVTLVLDDGHYYLLGYLKGSDTITSFNISRMRNVEVRQLPAQRPSDFNRGSYGGRVFSMLNGEVTDVVLRCKSSAMSSMIDKFGSSFHSQKISSDTFEARVKVDTSPEFYAWVFKFGGDIVITAPSSVKEEFQDMIMKQS